MGLVHGIIPLQALWLRHWLVSCELALHVFQIDMYLIAAINTSIRVVTGYLLYQVQSQTSCLAAGYVLLDVWTGGLSERVKGRATVGKLHEYAFDAVEKDMTSGKLDESAAVRRIPVSVLGDVRQHFFSYQLNIIFELLTDLQLLIYELVNGQQL